MSEHETIPGFTSIQSGLNQKRSDLETMNSRLVEIKYELQQKELEIKRFSPTGESPDPEALGIAMDASAQLADEADTLKGDIGETQVSIKGLQVQMNELGDPGHLVSQLDDGYPVLLLPVRVETRFMRIKHVARGVAQNDPNLLGILDGKELWIRIFPDDIFVHTHETELTQDELDAGNTYWTEVAAATDENGKLGAWRVLSGLFGSERAAWVARQTDPANTSTTITMRPGPWEKAPHTRVLPDRFVVRMYNGTSFREVTGNDIPAHLQVGIDPQEDDEAYNRDNGNLNLPAPLKWMTDFHEAEKVGMGIRVDLSNQEFDIGFDKLLVLGVKVSASSSESKILLEELIDNHHYTDGGFAIIKQGTPTNNTDDSQAGYSRMGLDEEESYQLEMGEPQFSVEANDYDKSDGQHLAEALGLSYETLQNIHNAGATDIREGMAMNRAIWPSTLGYFMDQMFHPVFTDTVIADTRNFFGTHVLGRGRLPSIRVDNQPYGIVMATAWSRWAYQGTSPHVQFLQNLHQNILTKAERHWQSLADNAVRHSYHDGAVSDPKENFLNILGLHASSVEFYQRFTAGLYLMWNIFNYDQHELTTGRVSDMQQAGFLNKKDFVSLFGQAGEGYDLSILPRIFDFVFMQDQKHLKGPVVDNPKESETRPLRNFTQTNQNYIDWLIESAWEQVRDEDFSNLTFYQPGTTSEGNNTEIPLENVANEPDISPPRALLYLLLRQSCLLEWLRTGMDILVTNDALPPEARLDMEINGFESGSAPNVEVQSLVRRQVESELTLENFRQIEEQVELETDENTSEAERIQLRESLLVSSQPALNQQIESEYSTRVTAFTAVEDKYKLMTESYEGITSEGANLADFIQTEVQAVSNVVNGLLEVKDALEILKDLPTARLERCLAESLDIVNYRLDSWFNGLISDRLQDLRFEGNTRKEGIYLGAFGILEEIRPSGFAGVSVTEVTFSSEGPPTYKTQAEAAAESPEGEGGGGGSSTEIIVPSYVYLGEDQGTLLEYDWSIDWFVGKAKVDPGNQGFIHAPSINHAITAAILRAGYLGHVNNDGSPEGSLAINLTSDRVRTAMFYLEGIRNGQELAALLGYQFERAMHDADLNAYLFDFRSTLPLVAGRVTPNSGIPKSDVRNAEAFNVVDGLTLIEEYRNGTWVDTVWPANDEPTGQDMTKLDEEIARLMDHVDAIGDLLMAEGVFQVAQGSYDRATGTMNVLTNGGFPPQPDIVRTPRTSNVLTHRVGIHFDLASASSTLWSAPESARAIVESKVNTWIAGLLPAPDKIIFKVEYEEFNITLQAFQTQSATVSVQDLAVQPIDFLYLAGQFEDTGMQSELSQRIAYHTRRFIAEDDNTDVKLIMMDRSGLNADEYTLFELMPVLKRMVNMLNSSRAMVAEDFLLPSEADEIIENATTGGYNLTQMEARLQTAIDTTSTSHEDLGDIISEINTAWNAVDVLVWTTTPANADTLLDDLRDAIMKAKQFHTGTPLPFSADEVSETAADQLVAQGKSAELVLQSLKDKADPLMTALASLTTAKEKLKQMEGIANLLFGRNFRLFPEFEYFNPVQISNALGVSDLLADAGEFPMETWLPGVARVRDKMTSLHHTGLFARSWTGSDDTLSLTPAQLPFNPLGGDRWMGMKTGSSFEIPEDTLSLVMHYPSGYAPSLMAGIFIDEWSEEIPIDEVATGVALNFNRPNAEAANALILAVSPVVDGGWNWDDLMGSLSDTLEWAKKRAVEPDLLNESAYTQILPMIMAPINALNTTANLDFGRNNIVVPKGQVGPLKAYEEQSGGSGEA